MEFTSKLEFEDEQHLTYQNDLLKLEVLGGIRLQGLDRMRTTLKIELKDSARPAVRHNLDLYNDNQVEKLIRKLADRLEITTQIIAASLSELTGELEKYRLNKLTETKEDHQKTRPLTKAQRQTAIENLQEEKLLKNTLEDLQGTGIQGEEKNALILFLAMTSRKCSDPVSVVCLARSGMGKSYLMEKVGECIPEQEKRENTQFTGASFYHFKREEIKGKVVLIEDLDGAQAVMFPIRELQTKKRISKTMTIKDKTGDLTTVTEVVEGPVSIIGCTTKEKLYEDNANRLLLIPLDTSKEQDKRIMDYQKALRAGFVDTAKEKQLREKLQRMQKVLEPVKIINPYAPLIDLPKEVFKPRRALPLLLNFMEAICFYHQYQRKVKTDKKSKTKYIEVQPQDVKNAFWLLEDVLFRKSDELSAAARSFYQWLKGKEKKLEKKGFSARDIRLLTRIHPRTLNRYLAELTQYGLLKITGGSKYKTGYKYAFTKEEDYSSLQSSIKKQIKKVMQGILKEHQKRQSKRKNTKRKVTRTKQGQ